MSYPTKWSTFSCTVADVQKIRSNVLASVTIDILNDLIDNAIFAVKNELRSILATKLEQAGVSRSSYPNGGQDPDDIFDTLFEDAFPTIREKVVYLVIVNVFSDDEERRIFYQEQYNRVNLDVISIWTDVDADDTLDDDEDINIQDMLNNRRP